MKYLFWISLAGLFYIYFGYPIILWIFAKVRRRPVRKGPITPGISVIIAAYNEENVIGQRLENILNSDYPLDKIEIVVSSDGSTDGTNFILQETASHSENVRFVNSPERGGKTAALNRAVPHAQNEILVFTDANTEFDTSAIKNLVRPFADEEVGCVAGRKTIYGKESNTEAEGFYWKYENFLRVQESLIHSCVGADGSIYAVRKNQYCFPDPDRGYADDGMISMAVIVQGLRLIYEPEAKAYETSSSSLWREYRRKMRTLSGGLEWMVTLWKLLIPFRSPVWWQIWSHKLFRFAIPYLLLFLFLSSAFLFSEGYIYSLAFFMQILTYLMGVMAISGATHKIFRLPFYLVFMNFVFASAFIRFLRRKSEVKWEKLGRDHL